LGSASVKNSRKILVKLTLDLEISVDKNAFVEIAIGKIFLKIVLKSKKNKR